MRRAVTLASVAIVALSSCAVSVANASASELGTACPLGPHAAVSPESEPAAQADAAALLAELPLPAGSSESATEPAEDDSLLAHPGEGPPVTPSAVDEHAWWLVPASPEETLLYICTHLPAATTSATIFEGGLTGPNIPENAIGALTVPGSPGTLVVWTVRLPDGSTALRADAEVVWLTPRPASETIPSGARLMRIAVHAPGWPGGFEPEPLALLARLPGQVTSVAQIDEIVSLLNGLDVSQPGVRSCPIERAANSNVELSFYANAGAAPLAVADIRLEGCGGVDLTLAGVPQPSLEGGSRLIGPIGAILGVDASVGPPVGPAPRLSGVHMSRKRFGVEAEDIVTVGVEPGTDFLLDLSAPAEVSVAISRLPRGARYADTCIANAERPRLRRRRRCLRLETVARFKRTTESEGKDEIPFSGKRGGRALPLGRYVAVLRARTTGGSSRAASVEFEITR